MAPSPPDLEPPKTSKRRWRRRVGHLVLEVAALGVVVVVVLALVAYGARRQVGRELAQAWLREHGVESAVQIEQVDASGFTGRLRLGPAADPDMTAERIEVVFAPLSNRWPLSVSARSIRLVRPRVKLTFDGQRISFGTLDPLVTELLARPKTGEPAPDIEVEGGVARLATPYGRLELTADGQFDDGKLIRLDSQVRPAVLKAAGSTLSLRSGKVEAKGDGESITASADIVFDEFSASGAAVPNGKLRFDFSDLRYDLADGVSITSPARLQVSAARTTSAGVVIERPALDMRFASLQALVRGGRISGTGAADITFAATHAGNGEASANGLRLTGRLTDIKWSVEGAGLKVRSAVTTRVQAASLTAAAQPELRITRIVGSLSGRLDTGRKGPWLTLEGEFAGAGSAPPAWAASAPLIGTEPPYDEALRTALADFRFRAPKVRLALGADPMVTLASLNIRSTSGARFDLEGQPSLASIGGKATRGGFGLEIAGGGLPPLSLRTSGYTLKDGAFDAPLSLQTRLDLGSAKGASIDAEGRAHFGSDGFTFVASRCARLTADRLDFGETNLPEPSAQACPEAGAPLIVARDGAWRLTTRLRDIETSVPSQAVAFTQGTGRLELLGANEGEPRGELALEDGLLTDTAEPVRFNPVRLSGPASVTGGAVSGLLSVRTVDRAEVGLITFQHDLDAGVGRAEIDASRLMFAEQGLQPEDLSPAAAILVRASGPASFVGEIAWTADEPITASGRLATSGLNFTSPAGPLSELRADLTFTSLFPLVTAPDQRMTVRLIDAFAPLQNVVAIFDIAAETLRLDSGELSVVGGKIRLEPVVIPLTQDSRFGGEVILDGVDLGQLLALSNLGDKVSAQAIIDGRLPFEYGPDGFRFLKGELSARGPGRLSIKREALAGMSTSEAPPDPAASPPVVASAPADPTAPPPSPTPAGEVNIIQEIAYDVMENLAFDELTATVESQPGGRLGMLFHIKGRHDPKVGEEIRVGLRELMDRSFLNRRLPLPKGTPIDLTLDTSLNFDELVKGYRQAFATLKDLQEQSRSETVQSPAR